VHAPAADLNSSAGTETLSVPVFFSQRAFSMTIVDIEYQTIASSRLPIFIKKTARSISDGYGAGNCTPESEAFWSLYTKTSLKEGWSLLRIELDGDNLSKHEISAAVRKVTQDPEGDITIFGRRVGRWCHPTSLLSQD
jgi:hypothetical protein